MPWKETSAMNQRVQLLGDWLSGVYTKRDLCHIYTVSRPTVDKWIRRYQDHGPLGLEETSRAPRCHPNQTVAPPPSFQLAFGWNPSWGDSRRDPCQQAAGMTNGEDCKDADMGRSEGMPTCEGWFTKSAARSRDVNGVG